MIVIKKILVGLDLSDMDPLVIDFASFIATAGDNVTDVYFVKVAKNLDLPDDIKSEFPGIVDNALKDRQDLLDKTVNQHLDDQLRSKINVHTRVLLGNTPSKKMIRMVDEENIDLIIVGRKSNKDGEDTLAQRLARRAPASLLIVPENSHISFKKLLVPVDFSDDAESATEVAIQIARRIGPETKVFCQNVYTVPSGYHYSGKSFEDFAKLMKENAKKGYKKFIKKIDTEGVDIVPVYSHDRNDNKVTDIRDLAEEVHPDLIVLGVKCRTVTTAWFIGNLAERVIEELGKDYPILVVRPKHERAGIMDYIREF